MNIPGGEKYYIYSQSEPIPSFSKKYSFIFSFRKYSVIISYVTSIILDLQSNQPIRGMSIRVLLAIVREDLVHLGLTQ